MIEPDEPSKPSPPGETRGPRPYVAPRRDPLTTAEVHAIVVEMNRLYDAATTRLARLERTRPEEDAAVRIK